jgi:hypothetical protein
MLARMNLARDAAVGEASALEAAARKSLSAEALVQGVIERVGPAPMPDAVRADLVTFAAGGSTTRSSNLPAMAPALVRLVCGSPYYQFI